MVRPWPGASDVARSGRQTDRQTDCLSKWGTRTSADVDDSTSKSKADSSALQTELEVFDVTEL